MLLLQSYAAASDPEIRDHVADRYGALVQEVAQLAEVEVGDTFDFFAHGMLLNVVAALDLPGRGGWTSEWTKKLEPGC
jgi:hypothetical protein